MNDQKRQAGNNTDTGMNDPLKPQWWKMLLKREIRRIQKTAPAESVNQRNALWLWQISRSIEAAPERIFPGADSATIINIRTGAEETISLNPKLSAKENAALYLKKSKKAQKSEAIESGESDKTAQVFNALRGAADRIDKLSDTSEPSEVSGAIAAAAEALRPILPNLNIHLSDNTPDTGVPIPYRRVKIDGWDIFLGRTESENDDLSIRFAAPADIWFHAAGCAGSHCIIRRPKGAPPPPPRIIEAAASLAAWYSKARNAPFAEVHMTEARSVGKRRGAPAGEVTVERWKSLKVVPKEPDHKDFADNYSNI